MELQFDKEEVISRLSKVLNEEMEEVKFNDITVSADHLSDILQEDFDAEIDLSEMDSNGWQMDFWIPVEHCGTKYFIEGSGYYRTLGFYKEED